MAMARLTSPSESFKQEITRLRSNPIMTNSFTFSSRREVMEVISRAGLRLAGNTPKGCAGLWWCGTVFEFEWYVCVLEALVRRVAVCVRVCCCCRTACGVVVVVVVVVVAVAVAHGGGGVTGNVFRFCGGFVFA